MAINKVNNGNICITGHKGQFSKIINSDVHNIDTFTDNLQSLRSRLLPIML